VRIQIPVNWFYTNEKVRMPGEADRYAYHLVPGRDPRPGNFEDELVNDFLVFTNQPEWVGDDVEGNLRIALRRAADAAVRATLDAENAGKTIYPSADERQQGKTNQTRVLDEILVALNKFSFHLSMVAMKMEEHSPQQDLKRACREFKAVAGDLQDAIGVRIASTTEVAV